MMINNEQKTESTGCNEVRLCQALINSCNTFQSHTEYSVMNKTVCSILQWIFKFWDWLVRHVLTEYFIHKNKFYFLSFITSCCYTCTQPHIFWWVVLCWQGWTLQCMLWILKVTWSWNQPVVRVILVNFLWKLVCVWTNIQGNKLEAWTVKGRYFCSHQ
jgi:hypothetical protein